MRTIKNQILNGDVITMSDAAAARSNWQLQYASLTDAEWSGIEQLFEEAEGQLATFTFLDPMDNLLTWSEDLTKATWLKDPLLQVAGGATDPLGGTAAVQVTNTAQTTQRVMQTVAGAGGFQYCFSVYLRSASVTTVQLLQFTAAVESQEAVVVGAPWVRAVKSGSLSSTEDGISFGLALPAGASVEIFGAQVEPQAAAGDYKKTTDRGGVYGGTRFDGDALSVTTSAPNQNSCVVKLISNLA